MTRLLSAFLISPISIGLLMLVASLFLSSSSEGVWALKMSASVGYPLAILVGIPVFLFLKKNTENKLSQYLLSSLLFSILLIGHFVLWPMLSLPEATSSNLLSTPRIYQMLIIILASGFTVFVFWIIARPDKANL